VIDQAGREVGETKKENTGVNKLGNSIEAVHTPTTTTTTTTTRIKTTTGPPKKALSNARLDTLIRMPTSEDADVSCGVDTFE